jgi:heme-degrading monooxygenase HmoA
VHARSTTITSNPSTIDRGIRYVQDELMPAILRVDGCRGLSLLVDRPTGRCIATSSWENEQAMRASTDQVRPLREDFIATFGGSAPTIEEWEIAFMHRKQESGEGACARVTWLQGNATAIDSSVDAFRNVMPAAEALPGFCSASLLVNRENGLAVGTVLYDSADAVAQTRGQANNLRSRVAQDSGAEVLEVEEFELAVAHLRIPELA